jgi:DNA-binding winged helix-turn-helix (wHTH) protein
MTPRIRFGSPGDPACFEFDAASGELLRNGARVRLQRQPARLLELLLARPGELVSREEIRKTLWADEVHVDFERSLNFCVRKLRLTLDDAADSPRFIETAPTRGYRFIAPVVSADGNAAERADDAAVRAEHAEAKRFAARLLRHGAAWWVTVAVVLGAGVLAAARYETLAPSPPKVVVIPFHNETGAAEFDRLAKGVSDAAVVRLASPDRVARLRVIGNATDVFFSFRPRDMKSMGSSVPLLKLGFADAIPISNTAGDPPANFPQHDYGVVKEVVTVSHGNLARLKELVNPRPALARVSWDWGFGDRESPIDAASHVGNRPIAEFLIAKGARPTIYTAAMMGQLAIVKQWIEAVPGVQRNRGPHGITLLAHAKFGGAAASPVYEYLQSLGDADPKYVDLPVSDADAARITGEYAFGPASPDRLIVARTEKGTLAIQHPGSFERGLFHQGDLVFLPMGAEAVRIRFEHEDRTASALLIDDGALVVRAERVRGGRER